MPEAPQGGPFPAVFGVLTGYPGRPINCTPHELYNGVSPIRLLKPREMLRTIALTGCGLDCRCNDSACSARAGADRQYLFRSAAASRPARSRVAASSRPGLTRKRTFRTTCRRGACCRRHSRLPPGQGVPPPGAFQSQPLLPPPGSAAPQNAPPSGRRCAAATARPGRCRRTAARTEQRAGTTTKERAADAGYAAAGRRDRHRAAGGEDRQQEGELHRAGQDYRRTINFDEAIGETVQFGALRIKTDACYTRPATEATNTDGFCRGRRDHLAGRGEADLFPAGCLPQAPACMRSSIRSMTYG